MRNIWAILFLHLFCFQAWAIDGMAGTSPVFNATVDEVLGVPILANNYDSQEAQHADWHTAHTADGQGMQYAHSQDFARDSATTPVRGLIWGYKKGRVQIGNAFYLVAAGTVTLTESQTTYVQLNLDTPGVIQDSTGWLTFKKHRPLYILRTNDTRVVGETDARAWIFISDSPSAVIPDTFAQVDSGQAVFLLHDFGKDTGNSSGLSFVIRSGRIRTYGGDTLFTIASTTITLITDTSRNYIQIDKDGRIFNDSVGFKDTATRLHEVVTSGGVIVKDTDYRSFYAFTGNMYIVVDLDSEKTKYLGNLREGKDFFYGRNTDSIYVASSASTWKEIGGTPAGAVTNSFVDSRGYEDTISTSITGTTDFRIGQADTGQWWLFIFSDTSSLDRPSLFSDVLTNSMTVTYARGIINLDGDAGIFIAPAPINQRRITIGVAGGEYLSVIRTIGYWRSQ